MHNSLDFYKMNTDCVHPKHYTTSVEGMPIFSSAQSEIYPKYINHVTSEFVPWGGGDARVKEVFKSSIILTRMQMVYYYGSKNKLEGSKADIN